MTDPERDGSAEGGSQPPPEELPAATVDAVFAEIIAGFDQPGTEPGRWPASEDVDPNRPEEPYPALPTDSAVGYRVVVAGSTDPGFDPGFDRADDEEGYVPPDPPPLPRGDLLSRAAWAGVIAGPLFLVLSAMFWRTVPAELILVALVAFIAGFVVLVARMSGGPGQDPDDDGAVV